MICGAVWGFVPGLLGGRLDVNETIATLLLNYVGALLVNALVYGPWKDPANLGWPATAVFPPTATLAGLFGTRVHVGFCSLGVTSYYGRAFVGGQVKSLHSLASYFSDAPPLLRAVLDQITPMAPLALVLAGVAGLWLYRTRSGLI